MGTRIGKKLEEQKIERSFRHVWRILIFLTIVAIGWILFMGDSLANLGTIALMQSNLLVDYTAAVGIASTLINVVLVIAFILVLLKINDVPVTGFAYAAIFMTMGFSFMGKNYYNILPIFLGVYLYTKVVKVPFRQYVVGACFATCLAPFTTAFIEYGSIGIVGGAILGVIIGFIICPIAENTIRLHNGFSLYNYGFAAGVIAIVITSFLRLFEYEITANFIVNESTTVHYLLLFVMLTICIYFIVIGISQTKIDLPRYRKLTTMSGRAITDYYRIFGEHLTFLNMGIVGLLLLIIALSLGLQLNGATIGAILSGIGFAAFGKNPRNILPLIAGCMVMLFISQTSITPAAVLSILFVTAIAPIAGEYGIIIGVIAGMLHFSLSSVTNAWQGTANLYNNGFASGFVAVIVNSVASNILKGKDE